jgi:fatty-acyl-CoA synthase
MIIRGGENIYPREIEDRLFSHPDVAEVAVVGVSDDRWGEVVAAFVRPTPGAAATEEDLRAWCRVELASFKTPQRGVLLEEFPLTPSGKIQKFKLREQLAARPVAP